MSDSPFQIEEIFSYIDVYVKGILISQLGTVTQMRTGDSDREVWKNIVKF